MLKHQRKRQNEGKVGGREQNNGACVGEKDGGICVCVHVIEKENDAHTCDSNRTMHKHIIIQKQACAQMLVYVFAHFPPM